MSEIATVSKPDVAKRDAIMQHATDVFADEGFRRTDVQVIADRAGVGKGTVYRYFGSKRDLFFAAVYHMLEMLDEQMAMARRDVKGAVAKLRASCAAYARFYESNRQYLELSAQDRAEFRGDVPENHVVFHEKMIAGFVEIVADGVETGELLPCEPRKTVLALGGVLHGCVMFDCYAKANATLTEMVEFSVDAFLRGISVGEKQ
jgi:AcrR family transcriptional regulator